jgi:hypothetical protein
MIGVLRDAEARCVLPYSWLDLCSEASIVTFMYKIGGRATSAVFVELNRNAHSPKFPYNFELFFSGFHR